MVAVAGREDQWGAACGAHDGSVELRVGEPPLRGLLRRRDPGAEAWLREHSWVKRIDAWARPEPALGDDACAALLAAALEHALGADPAAPLEPVLTFPGAIDGADLAPHGAPLEQHLGAALRGLVLAGGGRCSIDSGRPGELRAWVWVTDGELLIEREVPGVADSPGESWREPLTAAGADAAAAELARRVRAERPDTDAEPWFVDYLAPDY